MSDKDDEDIDSQNNGGQDPNNPGSNDDDSSADEDLNAGQGVDDGADSDDPNELKEKISKLKDQNQHLFERAKKSEGFVKDKNGKWVKKEKPKPADPKPENQQPENKKPDISPRDVITLTNAGVTLEEDIDEVLEYATLKKISISEALKSNVVKGILQDKKSERDSANATNTGPQRRVNTQPSAETALRRASETGEIPDNADDLSEMVEARMEKKKKR